MSELNEQTTPNMTNEPEYTPAAPAPETPAAEPQPQPQYTQPQYTQPNYTVPGQPPQPAPQPKSKIAAGLLGIFLGSLGVHNFYLGYTGKAVAQLLITLLTCGVGSIASGIWGLIEGILILTGSINVDGHGMPLCD